ncbi:hypothetical protein O1611_g8502 [Lasiodiplodia mahajangana]|uniref:Uncharacterized protein n=1 Tax=Lasiodiplodia mahajangana TaxID=1108764 RepID=A0ACC2JCQ2_9PEZI|nr:hypothetical protein O1611_g8502 [Lasiodiplodia mahajangana]
MSSSTTPSLNACEPCMEPDCNECEQMFRGITTAADFVQSREVPRQFRGASLASFKEHLAFIYTWGTGPGSSFEKLRAFYDSLPTHDSQGRRPTQADLGHIIGTVATIVVEARRFHGRLEGLPNDAAPSAVLRAQVVSLLEKWHVMHGYILWLTHLSQKRPVTREISLQIVQEAAWFPRISLAGFAVCGTGLV